jgi:uncharacterized membrane protein YfcA
MWFLVPLGLAAGALTTVAGLGGGQLLVLALAAILDPRLALVISAPALLVGNSHRTWMYRAHTDRRIGLAFAAGALPGSLVGGLVAVAMPSWALQVLLLVTTGLAVARAMKWYRLEPRATALAPAGFVIGAVCAASSGAGLLVAPILMATGLSGAAYVGTSAFCAVALHAGRIGGYALGGLFGGGTLASSAVLAAAILTGNLIGDRLRGFVTARAATWIERGTLATCVALALLGAGRR